jgi:nucleoid DNA-binding protein
MDVLFYLKELLKSHETISIAGLGTLYKKKSPGKYDESKRSFVPPSYTLNFTNDINKSEELINFIAQEENIDTNTAKVQINEFAEKILTQLTEKQEVILDGLGKLILANNEITFITAQDSYFGNEFYGLPNVNEIENINQEKVAVDEEDHNSVVKEEIGATDLNSEIQSKNSENPVKYIGKPFTPNFDYDDDTGGEMSNSLKILLRILSVIAIIASIIGLAYFFKPDFFDSKILNDNSDTFKAETVLPNDSLSKEDSLINIDTNKILNSDTSVTTKNLTETVDNNVITYEVIGSAEKTQKRIDLVINRMKKRGIEAKALENIPGKLVKISLGSFTDFNLAKKYQDSLRKKLNISEIYIQTIKPKK